MGEPRFEDHALGLSWLADGDEKLARASHAVATPAGVYVIDPVDVPGLDERIAGLGEPAAVLQLLDRHARDCETLAERLGVPLEVVPFDGVEGSPFEIVPVVRNKRWQEVALWWPERRALIVAESVGSARYFAAGDEPIGTHPMMRFKPPREQLGPFEPEHLLTGHGTGMHGEGTAAALADSLKNARRRLPKAIVSLFGGG